jgi:hypothetical protein
MANAIMNIVTKGESKLRIVKILMIFTIGMFHYEIAVLPSLLVLVFLFILKKINIKVLMILLSPMTSLFLIIMYIRSRAPIKDSYSIKINKGSINTYITQTVETIVYPFNDLLYLLGFTFIVFTSLLIILYMFINRNQKNEKNTSDPKYILFVISFTYFFTTAIPLSITSKYSSGITSDNPYIHVVQQQIFLTTIIIALLNIINWKHKALTTVCVILLIIQISHTIKMNYRFYKEDKISDSALNSISVYGYPREITLMFRSYKAFDTAATLSGSDRFFALEEKPWNNTQFIFSNSRENEVKNSSLWWTFSGTVPNAMCTKSNKKDYCLNKNDIIFSVSASSYNKGYVILMTDLDVEGIEIQTSKYYLVLDKVNFKKSEDCKNRDLSSIHQNEKFQIYENIYSEEITIQEAISQSAESIKCLGKF